MLVCLHSDADMSEVIRLDVSKIRIAGAVKMWARPVPVYWWVGSRVVYRQTLVQVWELISAKPLPSIPAPKKEKKKEKERKK